MGEAECIMRDYTIGWDVKRCAEAAGPALWRFSLAPVQPRWRRNRPKLVSTRPMRATLAGSGTLVYGMLPPAKTETSAPLQWVPELPLVQVCWNAAGSKPVKLISLR